MRQAAPLACGKTGTGLDDDVAPRQRAEGGQRREQHLGETAAAGAVLDDVAADPVEHLRALPGHALREQAAALGRGEKISIGPENRATVSVVAEVRGVERERHEAVERQRATSGSDARTDQRAEARATF